MIKSTRIQDVITEYLCSSAPSLSGFCALKPCKVNGRETSAVVYVGIHLGKIKVDTVFILASDEMDIRDENGKRMSITESLDYSVEDFILVRDGHEI